ncbi:hypothetical protein HAX54_030553 [Datura stramonium]|uniref:Uncharacterized protein n=1 Tax=Datura stramonium TaxID=4076 RepID=A0ABS8VAN5_DATST|nr:hypothetical protein [Datura stramonium]
MTQVMSCCGKERPVVMIHCKLTVKPHRNNNPSNESLENPIGRRKRSLSGVNKGSKMGSKTTDGYHDLLCLVKTHGSQDIGRRKALRTKNGSIDEATDSPSHPRWRF